jgi:hypothetical protein
MQIERLCLPAGGRFNSCNEVIRAFGNAFEQKLSRVIGLRFATDVVL